MFTPWQHPATSFPYSTYHIPMILERGDRVSSSPGSKSVSHSYVTGGSQTGYLGFLSCCQGPVATCWLIVTASLSHWDSLLLSAVQSTNLVALHSCCEQGCCWLAGLRCGLWIPRQCTSICMGHLPSFCHLTCVQPDVQTSLRESRKETRIPS